MRLGTPVIGAGRSDPTPPHAFPTPLDYLQDSGTVLDYQYLAGIVISIGAVTVFQGDQGSVQTFASLEGAPVI
jgi:hypothetical protein